MNAQEDGSSVAGGPYEVIAVRYGAFRSTRRALYASYDAYDEPDGVMLMDYFFWIARNSQRTVVVDTGFDAEVGRRRGREVVCEPRDCLDRLGIASDSVTHVVLTHFHYDHIGNVDLFPRAQLIASAREFSFWTGRYGRQPVPAAPVELAEVQALERARQEGRLTLVPDEHAEVPGIELLDLSGHTPGQLGVSVQTGGGRVVLASDAAHSYEEYERAMPFHIFSDLEAMYRGFDTLRGLTASPGTVVVPGHDPEVMRRFPAVSEGTADLAVRLA